MATERTTVGVLVEAQARVQELGRAQAEFRKVNEEVSRLKRAADGSVESSQRLGSALTAQKAASERLRDAHRALKEAHDGSRMAAQTMGDAMRGATQQLSAMAGPLGQAASLLSGYSGAAGLAVAAIGAFGAAAWKASSQLGDWLDKVEMAKDATGLTEREIGALELAASRAGTSFDALIPVLTRFSGVLADAQIEGGEKAKAFEKLGVAVGKAGVDAKPAGEVLKEVVARLDAMGSSAEAASLKQELFSARGTKMFSTLKQMNAEMEVAADRLGFTLNPALRQMAADADAADDALKEIGQTFKKGWLSSMGDFGSALKVWWAAQLSGTIFYDYGLEAGKSYKKGFLTGNAERDVRDWAARSGVRSRPGMSMAGDERGEPPIYPGKVSGGATESWRSELWLLMSRLSEGATYGSRMALRTLDPNSMTNDMGTFSKSAYEMSDAMRDAASEMDKLADSIAEGAGESSKSAHTMATTVSASFMSTLMAARNFGLGFTNIFQMIFSEIIDFAKSKLGNKGGGFWGTALDFVGMMLPFLSFQKGGTLAAAQTGFTIGSGVVGRDTVPLLAARGEMVVSHADTTRLRNFLDRIDRMGTGPSSSGSGGTVVHIAEGAIRVDAGIYDERKLRDLVTERLAGAITDAVRRGRVR